MESLDTKIALIVTALIIASFLVPILLYVVHLLTNVASAIGIALGKILQRHDVSTDVSCIFSASLLALVMMAAVCLLILATDWSVSGVMRFYTSDETAIDITVNILNIINMVYVLCYGTIRVSRHFDMAINVLSVKQG